MVYNRRSFLKSAGGGRGRRNAWPRLAGQDRRGEVAQVKLTLPWLPLGTYTYPFVAKKIGAWQQHGLEVSIDRGFGSGKVCVPVDQGQYDFGLIDMAVMMNCAAKGLDLVAVAGIWPRSPIGIFSLKEYDITKPEQLQGQTLAFDVGSGDFQLWPAFVKATGIDDGKVNKVTMDAAALIKALAEKQVKAEGNFFGSIAPSIWSQGMELNSILYEDHGVKMFSIELAAKRSTVEQKAELCQAFIDGLLEGVKYTYLNPDKSVDLHIESLKEFQGGNPANRKILEFGQAVGTALGLVPSVAEHGLGYMDPVLVETTRRTTYMGATGLPPTERLFTNQLVGKVKLSGAEWAAVQSRAQQYLPPNKT
jgi:NitT/TauT family transport system substrate-binding protein